MRTAQPPRTGEGGTAGPQQKLACSIEHFDLHEARDDSRNSLRERQMGSRWHSGFTLDGHVISAHVKCPLRAPTLKGYRGRLTDGSDSRGGRSL